LKRDYYEKTNHKHNGSISIFVIFIRSVAFLASVSNSVPESAFDETNGIFSMLLRTLYAPDAY